MTRELAAVVTKRSYRTVLNYERGNQMPPASVLAKLADLYGCSIEDFFAAKPDAVVA